MFGYRLRPNRLNPLRSSRLHSRSTLLDRRLPTPKPRILRRRIRTSSIRSPSRLFHSTSDQRRLQASAYWTLCFGDCGIIGFWKWLDEWSWEDEDYLDDVLGWKMKREGDMI